VSILLLVIAACGSTWELEDRDGDGYSWLDGDCNDNTPVISPEAEEICDSVDNDCDGVIDENSATNARLWYGDIDGDGDAGDELLVNSCLQPEGYKAIAEDCNDRNAGVNLDATEYCDDIDNDCNGEIDEDSAFDVLPWYGDRDQDGFGSDNDVVTACDPPAGYVELGGDCNDNDSLINPDAQETPNDGIDSDCDGED
jgi:hypothetical protein